MRPEYPNCVMTPEVIHSIRSDQEFYDQNQEYCEQMQLSEQQQLQEMEYEQQIYEEQLYNFNQISNKMSIKDKMKQAQGDAKVYPKISTDLNFGMKSNEGTPYFQHWDGEKNKFIDRPLFGVLIGKCFVASVFDDDLGSKGGTYRSSYYLSNKDQIALFDNRGNVAIKGTMDELETFASGLTGNLSKKQVFFVLTKSGVIGISTNLVLAIGEMNDIPKDTFLEKNIVLTPTMYDPDNENITAKTKKYLGKFATKNPPCYASVSIGDPIDEKMEGLDEALDMFINWQDHMVSNGEAVVHIEKTEEFPDREAPQPKMDEIPPEMDDDSGGLPF